MSVAADAQDAQKRKLDDDDSGKIGDAKRAAGGDVVPVPMEIESGLMKMEDFNPDLLRIYYDRLFPFIGMYRWLSYSSDPTTPKDFFLRREFTFVLEGDVYCRYQCFRNADEYRAKVMAQQPVRMEIGAVYTHPPKTHNTVVKDAYKPVERELVFDIDMDDYDDIRTCCTGSKLCKKCWKFMGCAAKTLDRALREDFGFQHLMFVYSGRRGMHCWVGDKAARQLQNSHRSAVAEYLNLVANGANRVRAEIRINGADELHPSVLDAHKICEGYFKDDPDGVLQGQEILRSDLKHLPLILDTLLVSEREAMSKYIAEHPHASSLEIWNQLEALEATRLKDAQTYKQKVEAKLMLKEIVIQYTYPRLDINVSKQMNHLLKSPFVVHPKTGRVCVPLDLAKIDSFDPAEVPTIGRLVEELNQSGDPRSTSLRPYTHFFEERFLKPLDEAAKKLQDGRIDF